MKTAFVTGGSRGIGREIVRALAAAGYCVGFIYLNSDTEARALCDECGAVSYKADVSVRREVDGAIKEFVAGFSHIDILVNNAAVSSIKCFGDISEIEWERTIAVNLTGAFNVIQSALPSMLSRHSGRIINISSMWGQVGASCEVHYSASKAGLIGMSKALAKELAPSGITVNCISPGVVDTQMNAHLSEQERADLKAEIPLGEFVGAGEIADAVLYLSGESAMNITGQVLAINGGMVI